MASVQTLVFNCPRCQQPVEFKTYDVDIDQDFIDVSTMADVPGSARIVGPLTARAYLRSNHAC